MDFIITDIRASYAPSSYTMAARALGGLGLRGLGLGLLAALSLPGSTEAGDPSTSWVAYTRFDAGARITAMNLTTVVPSNPAKVGASPSFWFGLQTANGTGALIQPILAWGQTGRDEWGIFHEVFDWNNQRDSRSPQHYKVQPGDVLTQGVKYAAASNSYDMYIHSAATGKSISWNYKLEARQTVPETTAFIVVEHAPQNCAEFPANGNITFTDITVEVAGKPVKPTWVPHKEGKGACGAQARVQDPTTVVLRWDPEGN